MISRINCFQKPLTPFRNIPSKNGTCCWIIPRPLFTRDSPYPVNNVPVIYFLTISALDTSTSAGSPARRSLPRAVLHAQAPKGVFDRLRHSGGETIVQASIAGGLLRGVFPAFATVLDGKLTRVSTCCPTNTYGDLGTDWWFPPSSKTSLHVGGALKPTFLTGSQVF